MNYNHVIISERQIDEFKNERQIDEFKNESKFGYY